ncbi:MAG: hypothetical protein DRI24_16170, partial [Deltaproteobacteria bacterium]
ILTTAVGQGRGPMPTAKKSKPAEPTTPTDTAEDTATYGSEDLNNQPPPMSDADLDALIAQETAFNEQQEAALAENTSTGTVTLKKVLEQRTRESSSESVLPKVHNVRDTIEGLKKELELVFSRIPDDADSAEFKKQVGSAVNAILRLEKELKDKSAFMTKYRINLKVNEQIVEINKLLKEHRQMDLKPIREKVKAHDSKAANSAFFGRIAQFAKMGYRYTNESVAQEKLIHDLVNQYINDGKSLAEMDTIAKKAIFEFYLENGMPSTMDSIISTRPKHEGHEDLDTKLNSNGTPISVFGWIPNFFDSLADKDLTPLIKEHLNLSDKEMKDLRDFYKFARTGVDNTKNTEGFSDHFNGIGVNPKTTTSKFSDVLADDPLNYFKDTKGNLPSNLLDAASAVVYKYLATRGSETLTRSEEDINKYLGRNPDKEVDDEAREMLRDSGILREQVAAELGKDILKQMNIKANEFIDGNFKAQLEMSLGIAAIAAMDQMGIIEHRSLSNQDLATYVRTDAESAETTNIGANSHFVRIWAHPRDRFGIAEAEGLNADIIDDWADKKYDITYNKLFGLTDTRAMPSDEVVKHTQELLQDSVVELSPNAKEAGQVHNEVPFTTKQKVVDVIHALSSEGNFDSILNIAGFVRDFKKVHITQVKSVEATNESLKKELLDALDFINNRDSSKPFYFDAAFWSNMRFGDKNKISLQRSKLQRFLFGAERWISEINLNADGDLTGRDNLQVAIVEALDLGEAAKLPHFALHKLFRDKVMDPTTGLVNDTELKKDSGISYKDAIDAINRIQELKEGEQLTSKERLAIETASSKNGLHSLDGLVALAEYSNAIKNSSDSVTVDLTREIDGTTNGVIAASLQLGGDSAKNDLVLITGGTSFTGMDETETRPYEYPDWAAGTNGTKGRDIYQHLAILIDKYVANLHKDLIPTDSRRLHAVGDLLAVLVKVDKKTGIRDDVTSEGRNIAKPPVMLSTYAASMKAIVESFSYNGIQNIYSELMDAEQKEDTAKIQRMMRAITLITGSRISIPVKTVDEHGEEHGGMREFVLDDIDQKKLIEEFEGSYGVGIKEGVKTLLGTEQGDLLINQGFINARARFMNEVFVAYLDMFAKQMEGFKGTQLSPAELQQLVVYMRDINLLPGAGHSSSTNRKNGLQVTKTEKIKATGDSAKVIQLFAKRTNEKSGIHTNAYRYNPDTKKLELAEEKYNMSASENIKVTAYMADIGKKMFAMMNQSNDGNVQVDVMMEFIIQNLHDATMSGLMDNTDVGHGANKSFFNRANQYSMLGSIGEYLTSFEKAYYALEKKDPVAFRKINTNIKNNPIRVTPYEDKTNEGQNYKDVVSFLSDFQANLDIAEVNKRDTMARIKVIDQYPGGGTAFFIDTGITYAEFKKMSPEELEASFKKDVLDVDKVMKEQEVSVPADGEVINLVDPKGNKIQGRPVKLKGLSHTLIVGVMENGKWGVVDKATNKLGAVFKHATQGDAILHLQNNINEVGVEVFNQRISKYLKGIEGYRGSEAYDDFNADSFFSNDASIPGDLLTAADSTRIFDELGNIGNQEENQEHTTYLKSLLQELITPALRRLDPFTIYIGQTDSHNKGAIRGSEVYIGAAESVLRSNADMSAQEVYTHELLHAIWSKTINKVPRVRREMIRLFNIAEKAVDSNGNLINRPETFLRKGIDYTQMSAEEYAQELEVAEERRAHVFDSKRNSYLHEFAVIGLTNEALKEALKDVKNVPPHGEYTGSLFNRLGQMTDNLIAYLDGIKYKTDTASSPNLERALRNLANDVNNIQNQNQSKLDQKWTQVFTAANFAVKEVVNKYGTPPKEWYEQQSKDWIDYPGTNRAEKYFKKTFTSPYRFFIDPSERQLINEGLYRRGWNKDNAIYKLITEIGGTTRLTANAHKLFQLIKHRRDSAIEQEATSEANFIKKNWDKLGTLNKQAWEAL